MSFPAYSDYKDTGRRWLGQVPAHWGMKPLWTFYRRTKRTGFEEEELLSVYRDYGVIPKSSRDDNFNKPSEDLSPYQLVEPSDLVINKMKAWQGSVAVSDFRGIVSPAYHVFECLHEQDSRYLHYLMRSLRYITAYLLVSKGIRVNQWDLEPQQHTRMPLLVPPLTEQKAIAVFLDAETAKIDGLVAKQRRLIELLKEKRQAVISHAVTKGLNPAAPMKPSGIPWLGDVPQHWSVVSVRRVLAEIEQGWSPQCDSRAAAADEWGILRTGCVNRGIFSENENKALPSDLEPIVEYEVKSGDVLMSRASGSPDLVGATAFVYDVRPQLMLSDKTFRIHLADTMEPKFFVAVFNSRLMREQIEQSISGAEGLANNLPQSKLKCFALALPPRIEQAEIVRKLASRCQRFDALQAEAERAIELLQERRTALISAAVTGKIDVRGFAP